MSIPGELERARQLILAAKEEAAKDILLSVLPEVEREDRDDLALEVFALLGELYLNRTAYDGTEECVRHIEHSLAAYADAAPRSGADHMTSRYRLRVRFLRVGLAAAQGEHEAAATELAALQDDDCTRRFDDLAAEQPTPRVAGPDTDEGVRSVVGEVEQGSEIHGGPTLAADRHDPNSRT